MNHRSFANTKIDEHHRLSDTTALIFGKGAALDGRHLRLASRSAEGSIA
jgi:hypothetical protein